MCYILNKREYKFGSIKLWRIELDDTKPRNSNLVKVLFERSFRDISVLAPSGKGNWDIKSHDSLLMAQLYIFKKKF